MNRKVGYYWVKLKPEEQYEKLDSLWIIAKWTGLCFNTVYGTLLNPNWFDKIDEQQITHINV